MKLIIILISFFISLPCVSAHSANVKGYSDKNSSYISSCNDKTYGYHKKDGKNHWHEVVFKDNKWTIIDAKKTFEKNPCDTDEKQNVKFVRCVDGDTALLNIGGKEEKFRFLAVDTPESVHPTKDVEMYAKEASKNTCDLLTNASTIEVEFDSNSDKKDKYNRNLAWIWVDDILLQSLMVSEGFARVAYIYGNYKYVDQLCSLQNDAISNNKGIWQYGYDVGYCNTIETKNINPVKNNVYTVTFKDYYNQIDVSVAEGMKVKSIEPEIRLGYSFLGWYHDGKKFDFNNPINSNVILEAEYKFDYLFIVIIAIIIIGGSFFGVGVSKEDRKYGKNNKKSTKHN